MRHVLLASTAAFALVFGTVTASAVDVVNEDKNSYEVWMVNEGIAAFIDILPSKTLTRLCEKCTLSLNRVDSVEAEGDQVAVIKDGKIKIRAKVN